MPWSGSWNQEVMEPLMRCKGKVAPVLLVLVLKARRAAMIAYVYACVVGCA